MIKKRRMSDRFIEPGTGVMFKCKICGLETEYKSNAGFSLHLSKSHGMSYKQYYDTFLKKSEDGKCQFCGKETKWRKSGYEDYCGKTCANGCYDKKIKTVQTFKRKTGYEHNMQNPDCLKKYKPAAELGMFLTSSILGGMLKKYLPVESAETLVSEFPMGKYRWDWKFEQTGRTYVVEFDGDSHYMDIFVIKRDDIKDLEAKRLGYKVVRIPYFVQMDSKLFSELFDLLDVDHFSLNYPHGFIDKRARPPASFCPLGYKKYLKNLEFFGEDITSQIKQTLKNSKDESKYKYFEEEQQ